MRATAVVLAIAALVAALAARARIEAKPPKNWIEFKGGRLIYGEDQLGNRIPDFSTAGYGGGGVEIPNVPVRGTLDPVPSGDDTPRIQAAIAAIAQLPLGENGFRGALLLHAGTYRIAGTVKLNIIGARVEFLRDCR